MKRNSDSGRDISNNMEGKICLITGANSGIGKATALELAKMKANVIMLCRDEFRGKEAQNELNDIIGDHSIDLMLCDLSLQENIRLFVSDFKKKYQKLHVLINNAGVFHRKRYLTAEGFETTFAVNYLAPFLLTHLLIDTLKNSAPSRIINVSSSVHKSSRINFDNLQGEKKYSWIRAYRQTKLALILFTYELNRRLEGTGVTVNALHPGIVGSNISRTYPFATKIYSKVVKKPEKGAETPVYLASSEDIKDISGKYFVNKKDVKSSKFSYDRTLAQKLWTATEELTGIKEK